MSFCSLEQNPESFTPRGTYASISGTARRQDWERRLQGYPEGPVGRFFPMATHRSARLGFGLGEVLARRFR